MANADRIRTEVDTQRIPRESFGWDESKGATAPCLYIDEIEIPLSRRCLPFSARIECTSVYKAQHKKG